MTILGRAAFRPGRDQLRLLQHTESASGTALQVFFNPEEFDYVLLHCYDIEKPSAVAVTGQLRISTNGATIETASFYDACSAGNASATIWASNAATNAALIGLTAVGVAGHATATSNWGGSELFVWAWNPTATARPFLKFEHFFSNSASTPHHCYGAGRYATGPIKGLEFQFGGSNFTGKADLYGCKFGPV